MSKSRSYCLTFYKKPLNGPYDKSIRYFIQGEEICPTTKRMHWQSYVEFNKPVRFKWVKDVFGDSTVYIEARKGTRVQARDYCKKDGKYIEYGKWITGQGHRTDLEPIIDKLKSGTKLSKLMIEYPRVYCRYRNGLKDIAAEVNKQSIPEWRDLDITLITGPTGCGKTREAMKHAKYKIEGENLKWWDGYDMENTILIDEYNNDVKIGKMLNILDGYRLRLDVKGGFTYANWNKVYITTNLKVDEIHQNAKKAHRDALFRRITRIIDHWSDETGDSSPMGRSGAGNIRPHHEDEEPMFEYEDMGDEEYEEWLAQNG